MSNRRSRRYYDLPACPVCGMYSGKRMMTDKEPAQFFVVCEICGFKTKGASTQSIATKRWKNYKRVEEK